MNIRMKSRKILKKDKEDKMWRRSLIKTLLSLGKNKKKETPKIKSSLSQIKQSWKPHHETGTSGRQNSGLEDKIDTMEKTLIYREKTWRIMKGICKTATPLKDQTYEPWAEKKE
jgi:hypothetical protein